MQKLLSPEEIAAQAGGKGGTNRLPARTVFADRAARLRGLAAGHAMGDVLRFAACLADAQQTQIDTRSPAVVDAQHLLRSRRHGMPPLDAHGAALPANWHAILLALAAEVAPQAPAGMQARLSELPAIAHG